MHRTRLSPVLNATLIAIVTTAITSATARAGDPNSPPPKKPETTSPATEAPSNKPTQPAKRTPASFTRDMPFEEAIDILRNCTTPPLNIIVLWRQIEENAGITPETAIGIDGVPGLRVRQYLDLLVLSLSAGASAKLSYIVDGGAVTIGTMGALATPKRMPRMTRVYDISDLVAEPARYSFSPVGFVIMSYGRLYGPPAPALALGTGNR